MSDWITDRRPTAEDADKNGMVLCWRTPMGTLILPKTHVGHWRTVKEHDWPWMPCPTAPTSPEPDTSLAASMRLVEDWSDDADTTLDFNTQVKPAILRIIAAAKERDELLNKLASIGQVVGPWTAHGDYEHEQALTDDIAKTAKEKLQELKTRIADADNHAVDLTENYEKSINELQARIAELEAEVSTLKELLESTESGYSDEEAAHAESLAMIDRLKARIAELEAEAEAAKEDVLVVRRNRKPVTQRTAEPFTIPSDDDELKAKADKWESAKAFLATLNNSRSFRNHVPECHQVALRELLSGSAAATPQDPGETGVRRNEKTAALSNDGEDGPVTPDPGEGFELCSPEESSHTWNGHGWVPQGHASAWAPGHPKYHRRRIVMTEPPGVDAVGDGVKCWVVWGDAKPSYNDDFGEEVRRWFNRKDVELYHVAWCHKLPGETKPPQVLLDWEAEYRKGQANASSESKRREWDVAVIDYGQGDTRIEPVANWHFVHEQALVREVLPGDPTPAEVEQLRRERDELQERLDKAEKYLFSRARELGGTKCQKAYSDKELLEMFRPYLIEGSMSGLSPREVRLLETIRKKTNTIRNLKDQITSRN